MGKKTELPSPQQVEAERARLRYRRRYRGTLRSTLSILVVAAAAAILVATLWMPVLQIYGSSMSPTVEEGEIVVSLTGPELRQGEIIAFYYNNKILVKRIIAGPGQWVDMDEDGSVRVDGELLAEPYLSEKALGQCDIDFPYQVPDELVRHGRPPGHLGGQPDHCHRLRGGGADRGTHRLPGLALPRPGSGALNERWKPQKGGSAKGISGVGTECDRNP